MCPELEGIKIMKIKIIIQIIQESHYAQRQNKFKDYQGSAKKLAFIKTFTHKREIQLFY